MTRSSLGARHRELINNIARAGGSVEMPVNRYEVYSLIERGVLTFHGEHGIKLTDVGWKRVSDRRALALRRLHAPDTTNTGPRGQMMRCASCHQLNRDYMLNSADLCHNCRLFLG